MALKRKPRFGPGRKADYVPDNDSFAAFAVSPQVFKPVHQVARAMKRSMRYNAITMGIYDEENEDGVHYADSFEVEAKPHFPVYGKGALKIPRASARIINTADHAPVIEFGKRGMKKLNPTMTGYDVSGSRPARRVMMITGMHYGGVGKESIG